MEETKKVVETANVSDTKQSETKNEQANATNCFKRKIIRSWNIFWS